VRQDTVVVGAAIVRHGRVLAARRTRPAEVAGGWELPGGKVEPHESPEEALRREIGEELACDITVTGWLDGDAAIRPGYLLRVAVAALADDTGEPRPLPHEHDAIRWLGPEDLDDVAWLPSDRPFLPELRDRLLDGHRLDGGNVGGAVRIGRTVRRPQGPWSAAVHALLDHLAPRLVHVPRHRGTDARGREVLDHLPGRVVDVDAELLTRAQLTDLVAWTRQLHEAVADFSHEGPWRFFGAESPSVVGHNDLAPYNLCFEGDRLAGVFDWDLAGPSTPLLELAFLAWNCVPLYRDIGAVEAAARLEVVASTYAGPTAAEILHAVPARIQIMLDGVPVAAARGDLGMAHLMRTGEPARSRHRLAELGRRIPSIERQLW